LQQIRAFNLKERREGVRERREREGEPFLEHTLSLAHRLCCAVQTVTGFTKQWAANNHPTSKQHAVWSYLVIKKGRKIQRCTVRDI